MSYMNQDSMPNKHNRYEGMQYKGTNKYITKMSLNPLSVGTIHESKILIQL